MFIVFELVYKRRFFTDAYQLQTACPRDKQTSHNLFGEQEAENQQNRRFNRKYPLTLTLSRYCESECLRGSLIGLCSRYITTVVNVVKYNNYFLQRAQLLFSSFRKHSFYTKTKQLYLPIPPLACPAASHPLPLRVFP